MLLHRKRILAGPVDVYHTQWQGLKVGPYSVWDKWARCVRDNPRGITNNSDSVRRKKANMVGIWHWIAIIFKLKRSIIWTGLLRNATTKAFRQNDSVVPSVLSQRTHMKASLPRCTQFSPKLLFPFLSHPRMNLTFMLRATHFSSYISLLRAFK